MVVHREAKLGRCVIARVPRRRDAGLGTDRFAEPGGDSGVECRNKTGVVRRQRVEAAGAQQAGERQPFVASQGLLRRRSFGGYGLGVDPRPRLGQVGQLAAWDRRPADLQHRQHLAGADRDAVLHGDDDEHAPGSQLVGGEVGGGGREQPRQRRLAELEVGEVVRLEVRRAGGRLGAHDLARINSQDVARAMHLDLGGGNDGPVDLDADVDSQPVGQRVAGVRFAEPGTDAAAPPTGRTGTWRRVTTAPRGTRRGRTAVQCRLHRPGVRGRRAAGRRHRPRRPSCRCRPGRSGAASPRRPRRATPRRTAPSRSSASPCGRRLLVRRRVPRSRTCTRSAAVARAAHPRRTGRTSRTRRLAHAPFLP